MDEAGRTAPKGYIVRAVFTRDAGNGKIEVAAPAEFRAVGFHAADEDADEILWHFLARETMARPGWTVLEHHCDEVSPDLLRAALGLDDVQCAGSAFDRIRAEATEEIRPSTPAAPDEDAKAMDEPPTTESVDWRSIFVRYARAVLDDDIVVGDRCLTDPDWCPPWTDAERKAVALVRREAWPDRYDFPQSEPNAR